MELSALPEDDLLGVLGWLGVKELLLCRAVCRRWSVSALHPSLWQNKQVSSYTTNWRLLADVLHLAPCLRTLGVHFFHFEDIIDAAGAHLTATNCAVSHLKVSVQAADSLFAALVIGRQASLGRLKHIHLEVITVTEKSSMLRLRALLQQLVHTSGLESVKVDVCADNTVQLPCLSRNATDQLVPVPPSLRRLVYKRQWFVDPYLHLHLKWHAPTLEVVKLLPEVPLVASLLSSMPRLHKLRCTLLENMPRLLQSSSLKYLHLVVDLDDSTRHRLPAVEEYLRTAVTRLDHLLLEFNDEEERAEAVNLVLSLKGTPTAPAALRTLRFRLYDDGAKIDHVPPLQLQPLAAVVHRMPQLTTLDIAGAPSDDFLLALDGRAMPNLAELRLNSPIECPHVWAHSEQVRLLLRLYSKLHVKINPSYDRVFCDCTFCEDNECHDLSNNDVCTLYAHPTGASCGWRHEGYPLFVTLE